MDDRLKLNSGWKYVPAAKMKHGYLAKRMAVYRKMVEREKQQK